MSEITKTKLVLIGEEPVENTQAQEDRELIERVLRKTGLMHGWEQTMADTKGRPERTLRQRVRAVLKENRNSAVEAIRKGA